MSKRQLYTEILAGITTFMTMAYILFVHPAILSDCGMDRNAVMIATALSAGITTIIMGLYAKYPFALAPGMGLNVYFAYSVCIGKGISWDVALGAVFIDGILFLILSLLPIREQIIKGIPINIKYAISSGIGLFIAFIGLQQAGIITSSPNTLITLGDLTKAPTILVIIGLLFACFLMAKNVKGALLWTILFISILGLFIKLPNGNTLTTIPSKVVSLPSFAILSKTFLKLQIFEALKLGFIMIIFTFTFVDMFDTVGTVVGLATKLKIINKDGSFPHANRVLITDSIGTIIGAFFGTSTVTTYIESASGISEGGKTGITAITTGVLFLLSMFFWPLATSVPKEATAPALILVGLLMLEPVLKINLTDITEALPAFLTLISMPFTYSITNGLIFGITSYVILKVITGRYKEVNLVMYILSLIFILYILASGH